jgi:hypothetical protein
LLLAILLCGCNQMPKQISVLINRDELQPIRSLLL